MLPTRRSLRSTKRWCSGNVTWRSPTHATPCSLLSLLLACHSPLLRLVRRLSPCVRRLKDNLKRNARLRDDLYCGRVNTRALVRMPVHELATDALKLERQVSREGKARWRVRRGGGCAARWRVRRVAVAAHCYLPLCISTPPLPPTSRFPRLPTPSVPSRRSTLTVHSASPTARAPAASFQATGIRDQPEARYKMEFGTAVPIDKP